MVRESERKDSCLNGWGPVTKNKITFCLFNCAAVTKDLAI